MSQPGYRFGLRQPTIRLNLRFSVPVGLNLVEFDQWICEALEADVAAYQPIYLADVDQAALPVAYLRRLLLVTNVLCQDVRIPMFERAIIVRVGQPVEETSVYAADLWFPVVDGLAQKVCVAWIEIAQKFLQEIARCLRASRPVAPVYDRLQKVHVDPWLKIVPGGKSTIPLLQGAFELGISCAHHGLGIYVLGWGRDSLIFDRSSNSRDSAIGSRLTHHKGTSIHLMKKTGIPVPNGVMCRVSNFSVEQVSRLKYPLVVKPADRDRGEGVTLDIKDSSQLAEALDAAARFSGSVLVEEQVAGTCHRILVVDGEVVFVVKRNPRSLVGDGVQTIAALVDSANQAIRRKVPQKRLPEYALDAWAMAALAEQSLQRDSIPAAGRKVWLRPAQSTLWGGDPEVVTDKLHPDNAEIALRAAALFGLSCAGVDLISPDIAVPWYQNGAAINEVNYSPVMGRTHEYQRAGIRAYLKAMFPRGGKIPLEVFVGSGLSPVVDERQMHYVAQGVACFVSTDQKTVDDQGNVIHLLGASGQPAQIGMLQANRRIAALLIYVEKPEEFLRVGLPFDYVSRVVSAPLADLVEPQKRMINLLAPYLQDGQPVEIVHAG